MDTTDFDPTAPLPGPPDPWASTDRPTHRDGPPFHMTDMIAAEPWVGERIVARHAAPDGPASRLAELILATLRAGSPVVLTGCGTSEHGSMAAAEILREATGSPLVMSAQAFELSLDPPSTGLVIGISHEGSSPATNDALRAARDAGAATALITVSSRSPAGALADHVLETQELDQSWCHTVGYLSPIAAATALAGHLSGTMAQPNQIGTLLQGGLSATAVADAEAAASALAGLDRLLVLGSGADRAAGRELVLKLEEGAWLPATYQDVETFLHGHLAATSPSTGLVAIATDPRARDARTARLRSALAAARTIGMPAAAIMTDGVDRLVPADLTPAGRIVVPDAPAGIPSSVGALLVSLTPLQTLTERLARARGIDPDPIHRDVDIYQAAADAANATPEVVSGA